jgi:peptidylprolyl isomerase
MQTNRDKDSCGNMKLRTSAGLLALTALIVAVIVAGCVENDVSTPSPTPSTPTLTPAPTTMAKEGDTVKVHYTGTLEDGSVFDTSVEREPLQFTIGEGQLILGFEQGVIGMKLGESKTITIPADQAYGPYNEGLVGVVERDHLPAGVEPEVGQQLQTTQANGQIAVVTVINVSESTVTVDANHHLAGKDLTFEIQLVEII